MASRFARFVRWFPRPLFYTATGAAGGATALYLTYRPRDIPGSGPAAVPPPGSGSGSRLVAPSFPHVKNRDEQIADLKKSSHEGAHGEPYDLLIIGGGATGSGIALDAVTRGLRVAIVERDDFSAGTSSKSTKLVHGGVRYLEKAVWELDYNQYVGRLAPLGKQLPVLMTPFSVIKIFTCEGGPTRAQVLPSHCSPSFNVASDHVACEKMVASALLLGGNQILRFLGRF